MKKETKTSSISIAEDGKEKTGEEGQDVPRIILYSLGNLSDKVSLVAIPLASSAGVLVPQIYDSSPLWKRSFSDYLKSIPGNKISQSPEEIREQIYNIGSSPSFDLSPKVVKGRTLSGWNLEHFIGYISSVVSAAGATGLLFDIRVEETSIVTTYQEARHLVATLRERHNKKRIHSSYILFNTNQILGQAVGISLELKEALRVLKGQGPADFLKASIELATEMLILGQRASNRMEARRILKRKIRGNKAFEKFKEIIKREGKNPSCLDDESLLPRAKERLSIHSRLEGFLHGFDMDRYLSIQSELSVLRRNKNERIDPGAGFFVFKKRGDWVGKNDHLAEVYFTEVPSVSRLQREFQHLFEIKEMPPSFEPMILERIRDPGRL